MRGTQTFSIGIISAALLVAAYGCSNETEGDRAEQKAAIHQSGADLIKQGEADVDSGKAMQARGQSMKDHGANADGEDMQQKGQILIDKGNSEIQHGRDEQGK